jgi:hypothetical protein
MKDEVIFSVCPDSEFFGRQREIEYICSRATHSPKSSPGMYLMGRRWMGKTEILRRVHHRGRLCKRGYKAIHRLFKEGAPDSQRGVIV